MNKKDVSLGILFFGTLIALGIVTIGLSDFALGVERYDVVIYSDDVGYLRPGDPVLLHGMHSGKVRQIERLIEPIMLPRPGAAPDEAGYNEVRTTVRIVAQMDTDPFEHLHPDYRLQIEDRGLLGGKLIRIEAGVEEGIIDGGTTLVALASDSAVKAAGTILEENRANVQRIVDNLAELAEDTNAGEGTLGRLLRDDGIADEAERVLEQLKEVGNRLLEGEGTLGKLYADEQLYEDAKVFMGDLRSFGERFKRGEGTIGKLINDEEIYEDIRSMMDEISGITEGDGTLAKLINDDTLYEEWRATGDNLNDITERALAGEGTIGRLIKDEEMYENVNDFFASASGLVDDIVEGDGLIAALVNDETLADDFKSIMKQALGAIEDARETTPVTSLGSFIFGTF